MRLHRAVPQIPPKSSVPCGLPPYKNRLLLTRAESILRQLLIPLHFNFLICNVYKNCGRGSPLAAPKFCNSSSRPRLQPAHTNTRKPNLLDGLLHSSLDTRRVGEGHFCPIFVFQFLYFESVAARGSSISTAGCQLSSVSCLLSATAYLPRNFSMVESSASAMSRYFLAPLVSCFCIAACALEMSVLMRC
jgi:hypothetical protein